MPPKPYVPKSKTPRGRHYQDTNRIVHGVAKAWKAEGRTCSCIVATGPRAGEPCGKQTKLDSIYCAFHSVKRGCSFPTRDAYDARQQEVARNKELRKERAPLLHTYKNAHKDARRVDEAANVLSMLTMQNVADELFDDERPPPLPPKPTAKKPRKARECARGKCAGHGKEGPCGLCPVRGSRFCQWHGGKK